MNKKELKELAGRIEKGEVENLYQAIHTLGNEGYVEARPLVERFLSHPESEIRRIALNVLTLHWMCKDHRKTCEEFIARDPDDEWDESRRMGVAGLSALLDGTKDPDGLSLLLRLFEDPSQPWDVRDTAYRGILYLLGKPKTAQPTAARRLDYEKDVNWEWIREAKEIVQSKH